jgi:DNA ligase-1
VNETEMMHGRYFEPGKFNVEGWIACEKLNGCRAYWDGETLWSRGGNAINAPEHVTKNLPPCHLDGEIYAGASGFEKTKDAALYCRFHPDVKFIVFDVPQAGGGFSERIKSAGVETVPFFRAESEKEIAEFFRSVKSRGGEGVMLHKPSAPYQRRRTCTLLKVKMDFWIH